MLKAVSDSPKISFWNLLQALPDLKMQPRIIIERQCKVKFCQSFLRNKPFHPKKNHEAKQRFARENVDKDRDLLECDSLGRRV